MLGDQRWVATLALLAVAILGTACDADSPPGPEADPGEAERDVRTGETTASDGLAVSPPPGPGELRDDEDQDLAPDIQATMDQLTSVDGRYRWGSIEHLTWEAECMAEHGFEVEVVGEGHMRYVGTTPEQQEERHKAREACLERATEEGIINWPPEPRTEEHLRVEHEAYLITHDCLQEHSYPTATPPTEDAYVEAQGRNWHPYHGFGSRPIPPEVQKICPSSLIELLPMLDERRRADE